MPSLVMRNKVSATKRILYPVECRCIAWVAIDRDDIEAARRISPLRCALEKPLRRQNELFLLASINAFQCATPSGVTPIANFDEYYCIAVEHDQIKLAAFARPVASNQCQLVLLQVPQSAGFGLAPGGLTGVAWDQGAVSGRRSTLPSTNCAHGN